MNKLLAAGLVVLATSIVPVASSVHAQSAPPLRGEVLEVIDVEPYTYLRLKTASGEIWAAVGKVSIKKGAQVTILDPNVMKNFESKTLNRTFPTIVFGTVGTPVQGNSGAAPAASAASPHAGASMGQAHGGMQKPTDVAVVKVAKAEGPMGRTVAEVNAQRAALKDKQVAIRATVVKVNANIMGKTWVHLRDGTGSASDGSDDLLATSSAEPKAGDVVLVKGVVKTDVDIGSGYSYKVLIDNASFGR